ncbi:glucose-1-phosphate cytidylyltransferase [Desulfurivibrio sp. D14AmB]|uniref:glucose-1-phosphate cytidylyltransferase n=1 Tax=Desulfurivibrio sp. D14AmB TaxID=3374370 RepID=UPI00376F2A34
MKALILAGGLGTRLSEETDVRPKPMVEIGGQPILWHIMKIYSHHGINDFVILLGYKGYYIKEYFANYFLHRSDVTIDLRNDQRIVHKHSAEPWRITLVDTGRETMTGGRIKRAQEYIGNDPFLLTYGDGVADIDIKQVIAFHQQQKKLATITAVQPSGRFGALALDENDNVVAFQEKPKGDGSWINGGFFVCEPGVLDYIRQGDPTVFEREPLERLASDGQLAAYRHRGFWRPMDTLRDKNELNDLWESGDAPWKIWE